MLIVTIDSGLVGERYDDGTEALYLSWLYYVAWLTTVITISTGVVFSITKSKHQTRVTPYNDKDSHLQIVVNSRRLQNRNATKITPGNQMW